MKKAHLVLLIITAVMALLSAYSLAAINQVYKIDYEWYSQYYDRFSDEYRETLKDKWTLQNYPKQMQFGVIMNKNEFSSLKKEYNIKEFNPEVDLNKYILLYCTLGKVYSPEYRIKIVDIAQRGNVVEIKVSINSPAKLNEKIEGSEYIYLPYDIIKINKASFPVKGDVCFIFKNQDGKQLYEKYYYIK